MFRRLLIILASIILLGGFSIDKVYALATPGMTTTGTLSNGPYFGFHPQYGDINGDGNMDMVIPGYGDSIQTGRIDVYFGDGNSFSASANISISAEAAIDCLGGWDLGNALAVADINGDGYDDLLIGALANDQMGNMAGKIYVFYGSASLAGAKSASEANLFSLGNLTDKYRTGTTVAIIDLNNDGKNDLVFTSATNATTIHKIYININSNNSFDFSNPNYVKEIQVVNSLVSISATGDFNGDGNRDLLLSEGSASGRTHMFLGNGSGDLTESVLFTPTLASASFGRWGSVSSADINNDGKKDFCVGAYKSSILASNQGNVYCFLGRNSFNSSYSFAEADFILNGQAANDNFGRSTYLYDVTNDNKPDLLVGAYQTDQTTGSKHGKFYIYKNTNGTFVDSPWLSEIKTSGNTAYGNSVSARDWDNDGWANIYIVQGGALSNGTGDPVVNYYEIDHGTPSVTLTSITNPSTGLLTGIASEVDSNYSISGVEWSTGNLPGGSWADCLPVDGAFDSGSESFSCNFSSLSEGTGKKIYVRTHDQNDLYMPPQLYGVSNTFTIDKTKPTIKITDLGLISNIPDKTPLFYYFTSQTPKIKGKTEALSTVHFKYGSNDYTSAADSSGNYTIDIPELPRQYVTLEYYAIDQAGNQSEIRKLNMTIGEENFPQTLGEQTGIVTPTISVSPIPESTTKPTSLPDQNPQSYELFVVDQNGNQIPNASVFINDQKYTTNASGKIYVEKALSQDAMVYVEVLGVKYEASVNGSKVIVEIQQKLNAVWNWWLLLILFAVGLGVFMFSRKWAQTKS